mmetsp:Transcript_56259/g.134069  ORF Transcript_56259/g.134069 Transcript_56259/m.134069 type:complete len:654 (+) Transcript_56259:75-2036(+)
MGAAQCAPSKHCCGSSGQCLQEKGDGSNVTPQDVPRLPVPRRLMTPSECTSVASPSTTWEKSVSASRFWSSPMDRLSTGASFDSSSRQTSGTGASPCTRKCRNHFKGAVGMTTQCLFPITTLPMEIFQVLEVMQTHECLREHLIQPEDDDVIHFISHEWLSFKHPDPKSVQLRRMQKIFATIAAGDVTALFEPKDCEAFLRGVSAGTGAAARSCENSIRPRAEFGAEDVIEHVCGGSVWLDYHSVPQEGHKGAFLNAVHSIPHYVERCDYFWVCAPTATHCDLQESRDFSSWRQRGWCRFEEVVNLLSRALKMPLIVTSPTKVGTYGFLDAIQMFFGRPERSVANGRFTCCRFNHKIPQADGTFIDIPCDKSALGNILVLLYMSLVKAQDAQNQLKRNMLCLAAPGIFDGYDEELDWVCPPRTLGTSAILKKYGFESPEERDGVRFPALMWVLSHGAMDAARDIVQQRPEALYERSVHNMSVMVRCMIMPPQLFKEFLYMHDGLRTREELNYATQNGYTPADRGAKYGFHENLRTILELKASTNNRRKDNGCTPLLSAAQEGYDKCVEVLLEFRADVRAVDNEQRGMLHLAGESLSTLGNSEEGCRLRVVQLALQARADPSARDSRGNTPLQACLTAGNDDIAALIQTAIRTL